MQEAKAEGKHQWNSCGSETGKDERKQTGSRVRRTGKESTGNQAGKNGENRESVSGNGRKKVEVRGKPEGESEREAPVEQLWERNREG